MIVIQDFFYNEDNSTLLVDFSTKDDGDDFYRQLELDLGEIKYYSPIIINEYDLNSIDNEFVIDLILGYLKENDLPEQLSL